MPSDMTVTVSTAKDIFEWDGISAGSFVGQTGYDTVKVTASTTTLNLGANFDSIELLTINPTALSSGQVLSVVVTDDVYQSPLDLAFVYGKYLGSGGFRGLMINQTGSMAGAYNIDASALTGGHAITINSDSGSADVLKGGAGDDIFRIYGGNDSVDGGAGHDTVIYNFASTALSNLSLAGNTGAGWTLSSGANTLLGLSLLGDGAMQVRDQRTSGSALGVDVLKSIESLSLVFNTADGIGRYVADITIGGTGTNLSLRVLQNYILGTSAGEEHAGTTEADLISAGQGNDTVYGQAGGDLNFAEEIFGGAGDDILDGGLGWNMLYGGSGNDTLTGGSRGLLWYGSLTPDRNTANYGNVSTGITVVLGSSNAAGAPAYNQGTVTGDASVGVDTLLAIDRVTGSSGNDSYTVYGNWYASQNKNWFQAGYLGQGSGFQGGAGDDTITGNGYTHLGLADASSGVYASIAEGIAYGDSIGTDRFTGVNSLQGGRFNDTLIGGSGNELFGPGAGDDVVDGGPGIDTVSYVGESLTWGATVDLSLSTAQLINDVVGYDTLLNIENVVGGLLADRFKGSDTNNKFQGGLGNDTIDGGAGTDTAVYDGLSTDFEVTRQSDGSWTVKDTRSVPKEDTDTLTRVEQLQFNDKTTRIGTTNDTFEWDGISTGSFVGQSGYDTVNATASTTTLNLGANLNSIEQVNVNATALSSSQALSITVSDEAFPSPLDFIFVYGKYLGVGGFRGLTINRSPWSSLAAYNVDASAATAGHAVHISSDSGSADVFKGGAGDDIFRPYGGNDSVDGGAGSDTVVYNFNGTALSNLSLAGNASAGWSLKSGSDTLLGFTRLSDGAVQVSDLRASGSAFGVDILKSIESLSLVFGTADGIGRYVTDITIDNTATSLSLKVLQNYIVGTSAAEVLTGTGTADLITAGQGNDTVMGQAGGDLNFADELFGGAGDDYLDGGLGWNMLYGGPGNDTLTGGSRGLLWFGSLTPDRNTANYSNVSTGITVVLGNSNAAGASAYSQGTVTGDASVGTDTLLAIDRVTGSSGNDSYTVYGNWYASQHKNWFQAGFLGQGSGFQGGAGDDTITGNGYTNLALPDASSGVYASIPEGIAYGDGIGTDRFTGVNSLQGGRYNDTLIGGSGNDLFGPGTGDDSVDGGAGSDTVSYGFESMTRGLTVDLSISIAQLINAEAGYDTLISIENVIAGPLADQLKGSNANNKFQGGLGNDTIDGGAGTDTAVYDGLSTDFEVTRQSDGSWTVKDTRPVPKEDTDTLNGVEQLQFSDKTTWIGTTNDIFEWDAISTGSFVGQTGYDTVNATVNATTLHLGANLNSIEQVNINATAMSSSQVLSITVSDEAFQSSLDSVPVLGKYLGVGGFRGLMINRSPWSSLAGYNIDASAVTAGHAINVRSDSGAADVFQGGAGDDIFWISGGNDSVNGGAGSDTVIYNFSSGTALSNLSLTGNASTGWLLKSGSDTLLSFSRLSDGAVQVSDLRASGSSFGVDVLKSIESLSLVFYTPDSFWRYVADITIDNTASSLSLKVLQNYIVGSSAAEVLTGAAETDLISAGQGNDTVYGQAGGDLYFAEDLFGGAGDDYLDGGLGWNNLYGGPGNDTLTGGNRGLTWFGSFTPDRNIANYGGVSTGITVVLGNSNTLGAPAYNQGTVTGDASVGTDTLLLIDRVTGSSGNDSYTVYGNWYASQHKNWFQAGYLGQASGFQGFAGDDTITGNGYTHLSLADASSGVYASIPEGLAYGDGIGTDRFTGVNALQGGRFNDTLIGGSGNELFSLGTGDDVVDGGAGSDTVGYAFESLTQGLTIDLSLTTAQLINAEAGYDTLINIENIVGTLFADQLKGSASNNKFQGGLGNDTIDGAAGSDTAVYDGLSTDFEVTRQSDGSWTVKDLRAVPKEDTDSLTRVELLQFNDRTTRIGTTNDTFEWDGISTGNFVGQSGYDTLNATASTTTLNLGANINSIEQINVNATALSSSQVLNITVSDAAFQSSLDLAFVFGKVWGAGGFRGLTINRSPWSSLAGYNIDASAATTGHAVHISGDSGSADVFKGGAGDDIFRIFGGNDSVDGGAGNDTLVYNFNSTALSNLSLTGNASSGWSLKSGTDSILGFSRLSDGTVQVSDLRASGSFGVDVLKSIESVSLVFNTADNAGRYVADITIDNTATSLGLKVLQNYILGTSAGEELAGTTGADLISAGEGNDRVYGQAGGDLIFGEDIFGGAGDDYLDGGSGWNTLYGGPGDDTLTGGNRGLTWFGSLTPDRNVASYNNVSTGIAVVLGNSNTAGASAYNRGTVTGDASVGTDTLLAIDRVLGSSGNDSYTVYGNWFASQNKNWFQAGYLGQGSGFQGGAGDDTITGNGYVGLHLFDASAGVYASIAEGIAYGDGIGADRFTGVNSLQTGRYNDTLIGGAANEVFSPGAGDDSVDGGQGIDTVSYANESLTQGLTVDLSITTAQLINADAGYDTLISIENVLGYIFADRFKGSDANNKFQGGLGNDTIDGGAGTDTAVYDGLSTDFEVTRQSDGSWIVKDLRAVPKEDTDTLTRVEQLQFNDKTTRIGTTNDTFEWDGISTGNFVGHTGYDTVNATVSATTLNLGANLNSIEQINVNATALSSSQALSITVSDAAFQSQLDLVFVSGKYWGVGGFRGLTINRSPWSSLAAYNVDASAATTGHAVHISGDSGSADVFKGGAGDDIFRIFGGNDSVDGGAGNDTVVYNFNSTALSNLSLTGNASLGWSLKSGTDTLLGFSRLSDSAVQVSDLRASGSSFGVDVLSSIESLSLVFNTADNQGRYVADITIGSTGTTLSLKLLQNYIVGTSSAEEMNGTAAADLISAGSGNDKVYGQAGGNLSFPEDIFGGAGDDYLDGGLGWNTLYGGPGNDTLTGGSGGLTWLGSLTPDRNIASYSNVSTGITVVLGNSNAAGASSFNQGTVTGDTSVGTDTLLAIDRVVGSSSNDSYTVYGNWYASQNKNSFALGYLGQGNGFQGGAGDDTISGNGYTQLTLTDASSGVYASIAAGMAYGDGIGTDRFTGVNALQSGKYSDTLIGGSGNDQFAPGAGDDSVDGGAGSDTVSYAFESLTQGTTVDLSNTTAQLINAEAGYDTLISIENVLGFIFADRFKGSDANNKFQGGLGNDTIDGGAGTDTAVYDGLSTDFEVTRQSDDSWTVKDLRPVPKEDTDTLNRVELLQFNDKAVRLFDSTFSPADESTAVAIGTNVVVTFSENIQRGAGSIVLKKSDGTTVATYSQSSSEVTVSGSALTINPASDLAYATGYRVEFAPGAIQDLAGNNYVGTTSYNFTTAVAQGGGGQTNTPVKFWKDASKTPSENNKASAVTLSDAIGILKIIVGLSVNSNNTPLSPYQAVAADFDQNGSVDLGDAIGVLKMVVGLSAPTPSWVYFDEAKLTDAYNATQPLNHKAWSEGAMVDVSSTTVASVKLVGVLTGDVDGSWAG